MCEAVKNVLETCIDVVNSNQCTLSVHSEAPPFQPSALISTKQTLPPVVNTLDMLWERRPLQSFFSIESKGAPLKFCNSQFLRSVDNHNRTFEECVRQTLSAMLHTTTG